MIIRHWNMVSSPENLLHKSMQWEAVRIFSNQIACRFKLTSKLSNTNIKHDVPLEKVSIDAENNWLNKFSERSFKIEPNLRLLANLISPHEPDPSLEDNLAPFLTDSDACDVFAVAARNFLVFFFLVFFPRTNIMSKVANKGNMTATFIFVLSDVRYCQKPPWFAWISDSCIYSGTGSMDITTYKFAFADKNNK